MLRIKQQQPGYYRALRQNRKILNRKLRKLGFEIDENLSQRESLKQASTSIRQKINNLNSAGFWKRLKYSFTGDMKYLLS
jgi:hypothetical protein